MSLVRIAGALIFVSLALPAVAAPPSANGETLFRQRCQVCHSVAAAGEAGVGPNLKGVAGRKAAATSFNYSLPLRQSKLTWTKVSLDRFLAAPTKLVPGTRMAIAMTDPAARAAVVQYLMSLR